MRNIARIIVVALIALYFWHELPNAVAEIAEEAKGVKRWIVYYDGKEPYSAFDNYDIVAFDSDHYPTFEGKRIEDQVLLGYLSTTEAEEYRTYFNEIEAMDILLEDSDLWKEHIVIDIRKPEWKDYFIHKRIPAVIAKGFDGIMLDTIDTVIYLEEAEPEKYAGMKEAAVDLIQEIRKAHPTIKLMLNRGLPIMDQVAPSLDYVLAESIRVEYNFDDDTAKYFDDEIYEEYVGILKNAQQANPNLQVVTLDYWDMSPEKSGEVKRIYHQQRGNGFIPYVTTVDLSKIHQEP